MAVNQLGEVSRLIFFDQFSSLSSSHPAAGHQCPRSVPRAPAHKQDAICSVSRKHRLQRGKYGSINNVDARLAGHSCLRQVLNARASGEFYLILLIRAILIKLDPKLTQYYPQ